MKKSVTRRAALLAAPLVLAPSLSRAAPPANWPTSLVIGSGSPGGVYFPYGQTLAQLLTEALGIPVTAQATQASAQNILLLESGTVQLGLHRAQRHADRRCRDRRQREHLVRRHPARRWARHPDRRELQPARRDGGGHCSARSRDGRRPQRHGRAHGELAKAYSDRPDTVEQGAVPRAAE
jgi:hypothetical protein